MTAQLIRDSPHSVATVKRYRLSRQGHSALGLAHPPFVVGGYVWADISEHLGVGVARARAAQEVVLAYSRGETAN